MASLQIRDMPKQLYESLKLRAEQDRRSLAQEAIVLLTEALKSTSQSSTRRRAALEQLRLRGAVAVSRDIDIVKLIQEDRGR